MTFTDEQITAWLDGEASPSEAAAIEAALAADAGLADRIAGLRGNDALLREAFPLDDAASPELLARLGLAAPAAQVIDLAAARERRTAPPRKSWTADRWRIAAQFLLIAGIGGLFVSQWPTSPVPSKQAPGYRVLGNKAPRAAANGLVMFNSGVGPQEIAAILRDAGAQQVGAPTSANALRVAIRADRRDTVLAKLRARPEVSLAEPIDGERQ